MRKEEDGPVKSLQCSPARKLNFIRRNVLAFEAGKFCLLRTW